MTEFLQKRALPSGALLLLTITLVFVMGCPRPEATLPSEGPVASRLTRVVILPFDDVAARVGEDVSVQNPLTGKVFVTGGVAKDADSRLTALLVSTLGRSRGFQWVDPESVRQVMGDMDTASAHRLDKAERIQTIGDHFDADAVLVGHVYRFVERVGGAYGIESPASVAFDLALVDTRSRAVVWQKHLDETQRSLSENMFTLKHFIRRKGRWLSAEEMAQDSLTQMIERLPGQ